ncbi:MAG: PadR family transcriptional regulator [Clostridia bacterium]|nr:PadR family transcriptional regulator [Clostridia bacterium]
MSLKHGILGLLSLNSASGYDLSKLFSESLNYFWMANQSQIYRELDKMEEGGWVLSEKIEQSARPNKRVYRITQAGSQELLNWLKDEGIDQLMVIRSPLLMKIFFAGKIDRADVIKLLIAYRAECEKQQQTIKEEVAQIGYFEESAQKPAYWKYTTNYCIEYYNFLIRWATDTLSSLTNLK